MLQLSILTALLYILMGVWQAAYVFTRWRHPGVLGRAGVLCALIGHTVLLYWAVETGSGQNLPLVNIFSLLTWSMGWVVFSMPSRYSAENIGIVLSPLSALAVCLPLFFPQQAVLQTLAHPGVLGHILLSLLAASLLGLGALQAVLVALQHARLSRHAPVWQVLPPLLTMEALLFRLLWAGFFLLTASLVTGMLFVENFFVPQLFSKTFFSFLAWALLGALLWGRAAYGWRGAVATRSTFAGVLLLWLAYFGSKLWIV